MVNRQFAKASINLTEILLKVKKKKKFAHKPEHQFEWVLLVSPKLVKVELCSTIGVMKVASKTEGWKDGVEEEWRGKLLWRNAALKENQHAH